MNTDAVPKAWLTLSLGAINGLVAGVIASLTIYFYNEYSNWRLLYGDLAGEFSAHFVRDVEPFIFILILVLFIVSFSAASLIVHRLWFKKAKSVIWLWQYVGGAAVLIGTVIVLFLEMLDYSSSGFTTIRYRNLVSHEFVRYSFLALAALSLVNYVYGSIVRACASGYGKIGSRSNHS